MNHKYVCVDLDGTIAHYTEWEGETKFGGPVDGVQEALGKLQKVGWKIIVYTTRGNQKLVETYLKKHAIPFDHINRNPEQPKNAFGGKPYAEAYIDDRGIQFNGDWQATAEEVLHFTPWELRTKENQRAEYHKQSIEFLKTDYEQAFSQLREYDDQIWEITKFSFLQLLASIGAVWTIFSLANGEKAVELLKTQWPVVSSVILIISFLFSLLAVQFILRIRVYFATTARYINDHRGFFLSSKPLGFENRSGFYTNYRFPKAFDAWSTQLLSTYVISLTGSLLLGFGVGLLMYYLGSGDAHAIGWGAGFWILASVLTIWISIHYLKSKKDRDTDQDVFGLNKP